MKKSFHALSLLTLLFFTTASTKAQSPRLQLLEYFDNNSIPPFGAVANAHSDSLMEANSANIVCIKYHVAFGSLTNTDSMNLHNPLQAQARFTYYNLSSDPMSIQDGGATADSTFFDNSILLQQSDIDKRALSTSPFTITVTRSLNAALDSIHTHTVITKTGNTSGALAAQVVVIEKLIHISPTPGVSGDTLFRNVMKRMLPSASGTTLPTMNIGDSLVLDLSWKLANVYDVNELEVVSFVQSKSTSIREVYQTGYSLNNTSTSIKSTNFEISSVAFPNPFTNELTLSTASTQSLEIVLYDITSKKLLQHNFIGAVTINTEQLAHGIYFYELRNAKGTLKTGKVVKQ